MIKQTVPILIGFIMICSCKNHNYIKYHRAVSEAEYAFYKDDYINASLFYEKAFKKVKVPFENDMYFFSASLWEIGETDKAIQLLDTLFCTEWALKKSGFFQGIDTTLRNDIIARNRLKVDEIDIIRAANPLLTIFKSIEDADQKARYDWLEVMNHFPNDSLKKQESWKDLQFADSLNLMIIDSVIKVEGFIGGVFFPANPKILHLTLLHQFKWVYENPKMFKKAIREGRLLPEDYAVAYDKLKLGYLNDTVVKYGQFSNELIGLDPKYVFKQSKKIGVSPYYKEWVAFPKRKGAQPEKHFYYDYYEANKNRFSCY